MRLVLWGIISPIQVVKWGSLNIELWLFSWVILHKKNLRFKKEHFEKHVHLCRFENFIDRFLESMQNSYRQESYLEAIWWTKSLGLLCAPTYMCSLCYSQVIFSIRYALLNDGNCCVLMAPVSNIAWASEFYLSLLLNISIFVQFKNITLASRPMDYSLSGIIQ